MEQLPHYLEFRGTMPRVHVRAHHQSAATRFRANVRKSGKTESRKIERKKWFSLSNQFAEQLAAAGGHTRMRATAKKTLLLMMMTTVATTVMSLMTATETIRRSSAILLVQEHELGPDSR